MLAHLNRPRGDRKLLLFGVACCRLRWNLLTPPASREAVEWAERFADGTAQRDGVYERLEWQSEGAAIQSEMSAERYEFDEWPEAPFAFARGRMPTPSNRMAVDVAYLATGLMTLDTQEPFDPAFSRYESLLDCDLLRDIFGNPFRPVSYSPQWRTDTAVAVARQVYESRDFGAMPILADALQDAGCDKEDILSHCRGGGPHARGCWVVDLVLGK
jgi:hypothetical protein